MPMPDQAKQSQAETPAERHARVEDLLQRSMAAHQDYRQAKRARDATSARVALIRADKLRKEAHAADPEHTAPAWTATAKTYPHDALLVFYAEQLQ